MDFCERLSNIFGTEEIVRIRRQLVFLREELENIFNCEHRLRVICSGSLGEGIDFPESDDDIMICRNYHRVVKSYREATQRNDLLMVPSDYSPGYCLLLDVTQSYVADMIRVINAMQLLSSTLWKQAFLTEGETLHGPCSSNTIGEYEYDHARCIRCSFWPEVAKNWIFRNCLWCWPSPEMIQNIVMNGCHVVPIGDQSSPFCQHEWRISFSVAERTLIHSFKHVQFLTYSVLRLCLKRVIDKRSPGVLCSYFMKTILFYVSENKSEYFWNENNLETCLKTCLSVLYNYVEQRCCPNYFIPEYNMIKRKMNYKNRYQLLDAIRCLYTVGLVGAIQLCGLSSPFHGNFGVLFHELKRDIELIHSTIFYCTVKSLYTDIFSLQNDDIKSLFVILWKIISSIKRNSAVQISNIFYGKTNIFFSQILLNRLMSRPRKNKNCYHPIRTMYVLLKAGYNGDLTTGKLTAATFMYLIGRTRSALSHIRRLLSNYPPYVIDCACNDINRKIYMTVMCGRRYPLAYKVQEAYAPLFILHENTMNAFPSPLRLWISTCKMFPIHLDPLSYTYLLECLCYIRIQENALLKKSTKCLVHNMDSFINTSFRIKTRMCIGIVKYAQNEGQSVCRWFSSAYVMKEFLPKPLKNDLCNAVMTYIACLLNNRFRT